MAKIKQLKDKSGTEQIFPKTKTQAIYNSDGTLLSETLDNLYGSLATIESSPTATSHNVGEYILYEGQVYKVTSVIASGDSLVVGTNISAVNLGDQISTLNRKTTTIAGTFTKAQSGSSSHIFVRQFGNVVVINGWIEGLTLSANAETNIGRISGVPMPSDVIRLRGAAGSAAYLVSNDAYIAIVTNGEVHVTASGGTVVYFNATYIAN